MGGPGNLNKYLNTSNLPFTPLHPDVPAWGFLMLGYRFEGLFTTITIARNQTDFLEMLLHDIVTIILYLGFLFGYLTQIGILTIVIHDVTDITIHLAKALNTSIYEQYSIYPFLFSQVLWLYFRLFCFPMMIYELATSSYPAEHARFQPFIYLSSLLLSILFCMHILWFYMFQRINLGHYRNNMVLDDVMHIGGITPEYKKQADSASVTNKQKTI